MVTAIGDTCYLYIDAAMSLEKGDYVVTPTGRTYEVLTVRVQQRGKHAGRQHLNVIVLDPAAPKDPDAYVLHLHWYSRNRGARR